MIVLKNFMTWINSRTVRINGTIIEFVYILIYCFVYIQIFLCIYMNIYVHTRHFRRYIKMSIRISISACRKCVNKKHPDWSMERKNSRVKTRKKNIGNMDNTNKRFYSCEIKVRDERVKIWGRKTIWDDNNRDYFKFLRYY